MKQYKLKTTANPNKLYTGTSFKKSRFKEDIEAEQPLPLKDVLDHALDYVEKRFKVKFDDFQLAKKFEDEEMAYLYTCDLAPKQLGVLTLVFKNCGVAIRTSLGAKNTLAVKFELRWETFVGERDGSPIGKLLINLDSKKTIWKDGE